MTLKEYITFIPCLSQVMSLSQLSSHVLEPDLGTRLYTNFCVTIVPCNNTLAHYEQFNYHVTIQQYNRTMVSHSFYIVCVPYEVMFTNSISLRCKSSSNDAKNFYRVGTSQTTRYKPTHYHEFIVREDCH